MKVDAMLRAIESALIEGWVRVRNEGGSLDYLEGLRRGYFQGFADSARVSHAVTEAIHRNTETIESKSSETPDT